VSLNNITRQNTYKKSRKGRYSDLNILFARCVTHTSKRCVFVCIYTRVSPQVAEKENNTKWLCPLSRKLMKDPVNLLRLCSVYLVYFFWCNFFFLTFVFFVAATFWWKIWCVSVCSLLSEEFRTTYVWEIVCMTGSTENDTHPKSTKSSNSDSSLQIQIKSKSRFRVVPRDTEESEFPRFGRYWGCSCFSGNCVMTSNKKRVAESREVQTDGEICVCNSKQNKCGWAD